MAHDIILAIEVPADAATTFEALTTQKGQASFWTSDCDVSATEARFDFPEAPAGLRMEVESEPNEFVRWQCFGDFPGWDGSTIEWDLGVAPSGEGTAVVLRHTGLHGPYEQLGFEAGSVAQTWAMILDRLQAHLRDGEAVPYFG